MHNLIFLIFEITVNVSETRRNSFLIDVQWSLLKNSWLKRSSDNFRSNNQRLTYNCIDFNIHMASNWMHLVEFYSERDSSIIGVIRQFMYSP